MQPLVSYSRRRRWTSEESRSSPSSLRWRAKVMLLSASCSTRSMMTRRMRKASTSGRMLSWRQSVLSSGRRRQRGLWRTTRGSCSACSSFRESGESCAAWRFAKTRRTVLRTRNDRFRAAAASRASCQLTRVAQFLASQPTMPPANVRAFAAYRARPPSRISRQDRKLARRASRVRVSRAALHSRASL